MLWKTRLSTKLRRARINASGTSAGSTTESEAGTDLFPSSADSSSMTSMSTARPDQRWSEVVPPDTALAFGAVWDPVYGIIGFSSAELDSSRWTVDNEVPCSMNEQSTPTASIYSHETAHGRSLCDVDESNRCCRWEPLRDAGEARSQVLTLGTWTITASEAMDFLGPFADNSDAALSPSLQRGHTQTSSTLGCTDVYLRGSMLAQAHELTRYSCLDQLDDLWAFDFDAQTTVAKELASKEKRKPHRFSDEGFFDETTGNDSVDSCESEAILCSAFSVTTTSTSRYISVERDTSMTETSEMWSTLEPPLTPMLLAKFPGQQPPPPRRRLIKKCREDRPPASAHEVLKRPNFNHAKSAPFQCSKKSARRATTEPSSNPNSKTSASHKSSSRPSLRSAFSLDSVPKPLNQMVQRWKQGAPAERWVRIDVDPVRGIIRQCYVSPPLV